jgi:CDP-diacylglycerol---glycerol-3-phosphate 3-phosphatidyltransferase
MNLANTLTVTRLVLSPVFFLVFFVPVWTGMFSVTSVVLLWILVAVIEFTDIADGKVARSRDEITDLGKVLDPFADVISRLTYFTCFTATGLMPVWILMLLMYREFGIVFIRLLMIKKGVAMAARKGGKMKAVFYAFSGVAGMILVSVVRTGFFAGFFDVLYYIAIAIYVVAVALSLGSFLDYIQVFRKTVTS